MSIGMLLLLFFGGCLGGLLAGLLGVGGGLVFVLIFTNYLSALGTPDTSLAHFIVANSMFAIFFAGVSGSIKHFLNGNFFWKPVAVAGTAATVFSIMTTYSINHGNWYSKEVFAIIFISVAAYVAFRALFSKETDEDVFEPEKFSFRKFILIGSLGGILASVSGVGGGIIMVPMLIRMLHIDIKKATAISLGVITIMALMVSFYSFMLATEEGSNIPYTYGLIILPMVIPVVLGCVVCSPFGVTLAKKIPARTIQIIFAVFLLMVISDIIYNIWL